ncbi:MAG: hypothetical protein WAR36_08025 [Candidatus Methanoculleus thermohydrogenotrophicum]|jgi:hypothetical protein|nr:hypothetical protein [Candidatus Methanoculleus thermohydrogenotrophicum]
MNGWTSHRKKWVPGVPGAVKVQVARAGPVMREKVDPRENVGQNTSGVMLLYGGAVDCRGQIAYAISEDEHRCLMQRLRQ